MSSDGEVKKNADNLAAWKERNEKDYAVQSEKDEKSAINFYGIAGIVIIVAGIGCGIIGGLYYGAVTVALGVIVMGIGDILKRIRK